MSLWCSISAAFNRLELTVCLQAVKDKSSKIVLSRTDGELEQEVANSETNALLK
jgi:hypothetical protein